METIYYNLDLRCVSLHGKASGGVGDGIAQRYYSCVPAHVPPAPAGTDNILDFERYRRRLEQEAPVPPATPEPVPPQPRSGRFGLLLDLCATCAIIAAAAVAVVQFLHI